MNLTEKDSFTIGGEELLASTKAPEEGATQQGKKEGKQLESLEDVRVRVGTLLKTETVSFLLGAGASVNCGGQLIGAIPLAVEQELHSKGILGTRIRKWLYLFYRAVRVAGAGDGSPVTRERVLERRTAIEEQSTEPLKANFEHVLAILHRWRSALHQAANRLRIDGSLTIDANAEDIDEALRQATRALARTCRLPTEDKKDGLSIYTAFVRKLLTRPLNLKRVNVFTLNYDTLVEQAADAEGVVLLDGFVGTQRRVFRPESFEQDLYFPAETTEGRVHRFDRVLHLYKLHGSISWTSSEPTIDNPYGVESAQFSLKATQPVLIYPTPTKYGETLGMPYSELFRRFSSAIVRPQSVLFVVGYGFGDEHVNAIIRQALAVPSFTLVIVDPKPRSDFAKKLRRQKDRRVWIAEGQALGTFAGFVEHILPDLRDEEIRKKVLATHRALGESGPASGEASVGN